jgi:hypothetical protein
MMMFVCFAFFCFASAFAPPVLPVAFNTSLVVTLSGSQVDANSPAFWSYDATQGGQYLWHPQCPFGGDNGCSIFFTGGYSNPQIFSVGSKGIFGPALDCCLFFAGVPILPRNTFNKYAFVINTTILHAELGSISGGLFFSQNRQCFSQDGVNLERIIDVTTIWDLPPIRDWNLGERKIEQRFDEYFHIPKIRFPIFHAVFGTFHLPERWTMQKENITTISIFSFSSFFLRFCWFPKLGALLNSRSPAGFREI